MKSERIPGIVFIFILIPLLSVFLLSTFTLSSITPAVDHTVDFSEGWNYTNPETGSVESVNLPAAIKNVPPNSPVRFAKVLPDTRFDDPILYFKTDYQYVKVILDGRTIYEFMPKNKWFGHSPGSSIHFVSLPDNYERASAEILITSPCRSYSGIMQGIFLGSESSLILRLIKQGVLPLLISMTILFSGVVLVIVFTILLISGVRYTEVLYLGLFCLLSGLWMAAETSLIHLFIHDSIFILNLSMISLYCMPIPLFLFINKNYQLKNKKIMNALAWVFLTFILSTTFLQVINAVDYHAFVPVFHLLCIAAIFIGGWTLFREMKSGNGRLRVFFFGCLIFGAFSLGDIAFYNLTQLSKTDFHVFAQVGNLIFIMITISSLGENLIQFRDMQIRNKLLLSLAYTDGLTGLKNRTSFDETVHKLNSGTDFGDTMHMIVLDINNLKKTNDTLGHKEGDRLISDGAGILKRTLGQLNEIYRIGGDEFAIIIRDMDEKAINNAISEMFEEIDLYNKTADTFKMSIAYGMASYKKGTDKDINSVFIRADKAMYKCKVNQKQIQVIS